jgi:hypothetical protein
MVFLGFGCLCKKINMFLYFQNKMLLKIKAYVNASERCFLLLKLDRDLWVHLPTLSWSCGGIKCKVDDGNVDMIFIMLTCNIHMGITS